MMLEEHKLDLSRPVATVAINMLDLWGGNNKNKDLYKGFFQNFNFVIGASYNRFKIKNVARREFIATREKKQVTTHLKTITSAKK